MAYPVQRIHFIRNRQHGINGHLLNQEVVAPIILAIETFYLHGTGLTDAGSKPRMSHNKDSLLGVLVKRGARCL